MLCQPCNIIKPERAHHCSVCNRCVLNMDHHCPWVNNCIGFCNRKYFVQLIFYSLITTIYFITTSVYDVVMAFKWQINAFSKQGIRSFSNEKAFNSLLIQFCFLLGVISFLLVAVFALKHFVMIDRNSTSIQEMENQNKIEVANVYDLGRLANWQQVMGTDYKFWFIPIQSEDMIGDGISWKKNFGFKKSKTLGGKGFKHFDNEEDNDTEIGSQKGGMFKKTKTQLIGADERKER